MVSKINYTHNADLQVVGQMEQAIGNLIFDLSGFTEADATLDRGDCAYLGKQILKMILAKFSPELVFVEEEPDGS